MLKIKIYRNLNYIVSFFTFIGYYAGLEVIIFLGYIGLSRFYSVPLRILMSIFMIVLLANNKFAFNQQNRTSLFFFWSFWFIYFIAILREFVSPSEFLIFSPIEYLGYSIAYSIIPFLFFAQSRKMESYQTLLNGLLFSGLVLSLLTLLLYGKYLLMGIGRLSNIQYLAGGEEAIISPLALSYTSSIVITIALFFLFFTRTNLRQRFYYLLIIGFGLVPFLLGSSRGSILAMGSSFLTLILFKKGFTHKIKYFILVSIFLITSIYLAQYWGINLFERIIESSRNPYQDASNVERLLKWQSAWQQFISSPIWGDSIQCNIPPYPHNIILEILMSIGIIGILPFLILLYYSTKKSIYIIRKIPEYSWIVILFIHGFMMNMVAGAIYSSVFFWGGLGLIFSISKNPKLNKPS